MTSLLRKAQQKAFLPALILKIVEKLKIKAIMF